MCCLMLTFIHTQDLKQTKEENENGLFIHIWHLYISVYALSVPDTDILCGNEAVLSEEHTGFGDAVRRNLLVEVSKNLCPKLRFVCQILN